MSIHADYIEAYVLCVSYLYPRSFAWTYGALGTYSTGHARIDSRLFRGKHLRLWLSFHYCCQHTV